MKISIVTITHNSESTLKDTLESVLAQTYTDYEYWIIDGKSTDATLSLIQSYEPLFEGRMKWISEADTGIYDALNKGIQQCSGDAIGILHSNDFFSSPHILQRVAQHLAPPDVDGIYGDIHYVKASNLQKKIRHYSSKIFRPALMRFGFMPAHPSCYIKRHCFDNIDWYKNDYHIAADFELLLRLLVVKKYRFSYIPLDMVTMRLGGVSTRGITSHKTILQEQTRALHENHIRSNVLILSLRYIYKMGEIDYWRWLGRK